MKLRGVLLNTYEEQVAGGDVTPVKVEGVEFDPEAIYPVSLGFAEPIGTARVSFVEGRLVAICEVGVEHVDMLDPWMKLAAGLTGIDTHYDNDAKLHVFNKSRLHDVALVTENADRSITPFEVLVD